jgi:hypothetical protein
MVGENSISNNDYELGIGYGFLDKQVQVSVDGVPVLFLVGNEKMETFAQMQGTNMLYSGTSKQEEITVSVSVDGDQPIEKIIDLNDGIYIHVYQDITGVKIYNTSVLIFE